MTESAFFDLTDQLLDSLQIALDDSDLDLDFELQDGVLEIEFASGEKMIINRHAANREIWVAAKAGGFHFSLNVEGQWINMRDGSELKQVVSQLIEQNGNHTFSWS